MLRAAEATQFSEIASLADGNTFPSSSDFQTFNPYDVAPPTGSERTVREDGAGSRHIVQTFQLDSEVMIDTIDLMFVRGARGNVGALRIYDVADTLSEDYSTDAAGTPCWTSSSRRRPD